MGAWRGEEQGEYEVSSNGRMVWVAGPKGTGIARFSPSGGEVARASGRLVMDVLPRCAWLDWAALVEARFPVVVESHRPDGM